MIPLEMAVSKLRIINLPQRRGGHKDINFVKFPLFTLRPLSLCGKFLVLRQSVPKGRAGWGLIL
jgi:hypothetical protein